MDLQTKVMIANKLRDAFFQFYKTNNCECHKRKNYLMLGNPALKLAIVTS